VAGNLIPENSNPYAANYCGYQFGTFAGQLGDGAAISLGEVIATERVQGTNSNTNSNSNAGTCVHMMEVDRSECKEASDFDMNSELDLGSQSQAQDTYLLNRNELNIKGAGLTPFSRK